MELEQLWKRTENHLYWSLHLPRSANPQIRLTVKTFIFRFFITNTFSSYALLIWEVSTIKHKFLNNSVERVSFEVGRLPSGRSTAPLFFTQWMKISCSSRAICENKSKMILPTHHPQLMSLSKKTCRLLGLEGLAGRDRCDILDTYIGKQKKGTLKARGGTKSIFNKRKNIRGYGGHQAPRN